MSRLPPVFGLIVWTASRFRFGVVDGPPYSPGIHRPDSVHLAVALRAECNCFVTFNTRHFKNAEKFIEITNAKDTLLNYLQKF